MPRLSAVLVTVLSTLGVAIGVLMVVGGPAHPAAAAPLAQTDRVNAQLYMSDVRDGDPRRNFGAAATSLFAVVAYDNAAGGEQFVVQLRDLSGVVVKKQSLPALSAGAGKRSIAVSAADFVSSYRSAISVTQLALSESIASVGTKCQNFPPPPDTWPIQLPTPQPGQPTPTASPPHPYQRWLPTILDPLDASALTTSELSRTLQAMLGLPDMAPGRAGAAAVPDLSAARNALEQALVKLQQVPGLLQPQQANEGPPIKPDPARGCMIVAEATALIATAQTKVATGLAAVPSDTTGWAIPRTTASYQGSRLQACVQYNTDLFDVVGGQQRTTPADTALWTVGDPGAPALIFPSPDQTDRGNLGGLRLTYPDGATAVYATSVTAPGVNHQARFSAFVTDRNCLPVSGTKVEFSLDPTGFGTLSSAEVTPVEGVAEVTYTAGSAVPAPQPDHGQVTLRADAGDIEAATKFNVVGPAVNMRIIVNPKAIHRIRDRRGGVTVEIKDLNGNNVADGTPVKLRLLPPSVGYLAYERRVPGQNEPEVVNSGTSIDLITDRGRTIVPPSQSNLAGVYIVSDGRDGDVIVEVEADGAKANSNIVEVGKPPVAGVSIVSTGTIFLPIALRTSGFVRSQPIASRTRPAVSAFETPIP